MDLSSIMKQDQASGLRDLCKGESSTKVVAVTAGKGGVGKTNISVNLSIALSSVNKNVLLFDGDLGLANVDVMLGLHAGMNLSHVLDGRCQLEDILLTGPAGLKIIPAASGVKLMTELGARECNSILHAFNVSTSPFDVLVIDTAAGISDSVLNFISAAQDVIVVVCDEPSSITDAYALIKLMSNQHNVDHFHIISNMVASPKQGKDLFSKLSKVTNQFLDVVLNYLGYIPFDDLLRKSVRQQRAVVDAFPTSKSAKEFIKIARKISDKYKIEEIHPNSDFYLERLAKYNLSVWQGE